MKISLFLDVVYQVAKESDLSFGEALVYIRELGISGVEPGIDSVNKAGGCEKFRSVIEDAGLRIFACHKFTRLYEDSDLQNGMRFVDEAKALGAKAALILPGPVESISRREEERAQMAHQLSKLAEYSEKSGVKLCLENFSRPECPYTFIEDFVYLLETVPGLYMNFDSGNFCFVGQSPSQAVDIISKLRPIPFSNVHFKNYSFEKYNDNPSTAGKTPDGKSFYSYPVISGGAVDLNYIFDVLKAIGYDENISIENGGIYPAEPALTDSVEWLKTRII